MFATEHLENKNRLATPNLRDGFLMQDFSIE
jgi:hypothetical protein